MQFLDDIFGAGRELTVMQMSARAFVFFFITLLFLRIAGMRTLGKQSAIDMVILIVMGSIVSRGIAGVSGFLHTVAASGVLVVLHRIISWITHKNRHFETLIKGKRLLLFEDGSFLQGNMEKAGISENDFLEALRIATQLDDCTMISTAYLETNGQVSFVKKKETQRQPGHFESTII